MDDSEEIVEEVLEEEEETVFEEEEEEDDQEDDRSKRLKRPPQVLDENTKFSFKDHFAPPGNIIDTEKDLELFVVDIECQNRWISDECYDDPKVAEDRLLYNGDSNKRYRSSVRVPCIRIYCKTRTGNTVCLNTYGYYPVVHLLLSRVPSLSFIDEIRERVCYLFFLL